MDFDRDFGVNQVFVDDLYQQWRQNPAAVDETWNGYFSALSGLSQPASPWGAPLPAPLAGEGANGADRPLFQQAPDLHGLSVAPPPRSASAPAALPVGDRRKGDQALKALQDAVSRLIETYRHRGHYHAQVDPLGLRHLDRGELALGKFGLSEADLDTSFVTDLPGLSPARLRDILARLEQTYCGSLGVEYMHSEDPRIRGFLQQRMESSGNRAKLSREEKLRILARLTDAETLEQFLHKKYIGAKRFSLEGGESFIPLMDWLVEDAAGRGVTEVVVGMAHRGRLNLLANVMGKRAGDIFAEFEDSDAEVLIGRGDVKYHMGYSSDRVTRAGKAVHLSLAFNPSHLEIVNTVVEGRVRAKQDREARDPSRRHVLPVLIHGDAAFAGQGPVAELLNMAGLPGYRTGGTLHVVINNQIGFTTNPDDSRSTPYCTDIARSLRAPVFHVNGEDPEAVVWAVQLAVEYRQTFQQDVLIDLFCYRKYGHNEGDEPAFTQPRMYEIIRKKPAPREIYARALVAEGTLSQAEADGLVLLTHGRLEEELEQTRKSGTKRTLSGMAGLWAHYRGGAEKDAPDVDTSVPLEKLRELLVSIGRVPASFTPHDKIRKLLEDRSKLALPGAERAPFDWGVGEHLAFASLLSEGTSIRFSGQDSRRGTFSHRHASLVDVKTGERFLPLSTVARKGARMDIFDSPLSEAGVVGFDYGFSLDAPDWLTCWEAQFGDFANCAQVVIDQFITSAEDKWMRLSGMVLLLPHGFEGQGPEHSSARLERFLQACAEDNLQVCNLTTPANLFHVLRRQMLRAWRKPLAIMTPKSLLRHKHAVSTLLDLAQGGFQRVLGDAAFGPGGAEPQGVRKVLLCSGKVFYDLRAAREARRKKDVAILRLEQLYPFPEKELIAQLARYPAAAQLVWVQEEPFNMGAWFPLSARWPKDRLRAPVACVSRPEGSSPATGSAASHKLEQQLLVDEALA